MADTPGTDGDSNPAAGTADETTFEVQLSGPESDRFLFDETDVKAVGSVRDRGDAFELPTALTTAGAARVSDTFRTAGVAKHPETFEIELIHAGEVISRFGIAPGLATKVVATKWDGELLLAFTQRKSATTVRDILVDSGAATNQPPPAAAEDGTTAGTPPAGEALVIESKLPRDGTNVNLGVEGSAKNTASIALVDCRIVVTGDVGEQTFQARAQRDRLGPGATWEWAVEFGPEADALQDNSVEHISIDTQAAYD